MYNKTYFIGNCSSNWIFDSDYPMKVELLTKESQEDEYNNMCYEYNGYRKLVFVKKYKYGKYYGVISDLTIKGKWILFKMRTK